MLPGIFEGRGERGLVRLGGAGPGGGGVAWPGVAAEPLAGGEAVELVVRPEALALVPPGTAGSLSGRVAERRYAGSATFYLVELAGGGLEVEVAAGAGAAPVGDEVAVAPAAGPGAAAGRIFRRAEPAEGRL